MHIRRGIYIFNYEFPKDYRNIPFSHRKVEFAIFQARARNKIKSCFHSLSPAVYSKYFTVIHCTSRNFVPRRQRIFVSLRQFFSVVGGGPITRELSPKAMPPL